MKLLKCLLVVVGFLCSSFARADTLGNAYKLHASEESALKSIAGTQKHVLIFFSDSHK